MSELYVYGESCGLLSSSVGESAVSDAREEARNEGEEGCWVVMRVLEGA